MNDDFTPFSSTGLVPFLIEYARDADGETLKKLFYGAVCELSAHEARARNRYPLAYWPYAYTARLVAHPNTPFERRLAARFADFAARHR